MGNMILLGGIHGVGKTHFCEEALSIAGIISFTASKLISDYKKEEFPKDKRIKDIDDNQTILLRALENKKIKQEQWFILDGHFCLLNEHGSVTNIPKETFKALSPKMLIVLKDEVKRIHNNLLKRDNGNMDENLLQHFQETEIDYAQAIAKELIIPCFVFDSSKDIGSIIKEIDHFKNGNKLEKHIV